MSNKSKQIQLPSATFVLNELVFAKIKGSVAWPSRIIFIDGAFLRVSFFGDNGSVYVIKYHSIHTPAVRCIPHCLIPLFS